MPILFIRAHLLFERSDAIIHLCEVKYSASAYLVDKKTYKDLINKIEVFNKQTQNKKTLFLSMIATQGLKSNFYAEEIIQGVVTLKDFFKAL